MSLVAKGGAAAVAAAFAFSGGGGADIKRPVVIRMDPGPTCSFEWAPDVFFTLRVSEGDMSLSGPRQLYRAPYSYASNPDGSVYEAHFPGGRSAALYDDGSTPLRLVLAPGGEVGCHP